MRQYNILIRSLIFFVFVLLVVLIYTTDVDAQCAMCKASAESNIKGNNNKVGQGLNTGILYMMAFPYILLMGLCWFFFKKQITAKINEWRLVTNVKFLRKGE